MPDNGRTAMSPAHSPKLSIVTPMYNEEDNIRQFCQRLFGTLDVLSDTWEVICVNDGSTDRTLELLLEEQSMRRGLTVVSLARNFGQHAAVLAGFAQCRGDWVITLDADLQNFPEDIPRLVEALRKGHDLVGTVRIGRQDSMVRTWASGVSNRLITTITGIALQDMGCMLRGYSREVVAEILQNPEYRTFIPVLGTLFARHPVEIPVRHTARAAGASKYSLLKLLSLQLDLMSGFSLWPLRALFFVGTGVAALGLGMGMLILALRLYYGSAWAVEGVFTLFAVLFCFVGAQFFALGLMGEYIGRIFQAVRKRPLFVLDALYHDEEGGSSGGQRGEEKQ
jgi:undecaprenyl-phosphate 4-deoxy-4-formamido-L-arabinose transferase